MDFQYFTFWLTVVMFLSGVVSLLLFLFLPSGIFHVSGQRLSTLCGASLIVCFFAAFAYTLYDYITFHVKRPVKQVSKTSVPLQIPDSNWTLEGGNWKAKVFYRDSATGYFVEDITPPGVPFTIQDTAWIGDTPKPAPPPPAAIDTVLTRFTSSQDRIIAQAHLVAELLRYKQRQYAALADYCNGGHVSQRLRKLANRYNDSTDLLWDNFEKVYGK